MRQKTSIDNRFLSHATFLVKPIRDADLKVQKSIPKITEITKFQNIPEKITIRKGKETSQYDSFHWPTTEKTFFPQSVGTKEIFSIETK